MLIISVKPRAFFHNIHYLRTLKPFKELLRQKPVSGFQIATGSWGTLQTVVRIMRVCIDYRRDVASRSMRCDGSGGAWDADLYYGHR